MTDTTDIKALRELLCHENKESDHYIGVTVTTLRLLISKADQLESERQRADKSDAMLSEYLESLKAAEAALAALKGEQVPVEYQMHYHNHGTGGGEWCRVRTKARYEELQREHAGDNDFSFRTLFTAPQKPVVLRPSLHPSHSYASVAVSGRDEQWYAAIEAAGGIVKDGE